MTGIYVHLPFCVRKCLYCDFYSVTETDAVDRYLRALLAEMEPHAGLAIDSLFFGGGTPTRIGGRLAELCRETLALFRPTADCEVTVEANPGTVDFALLCALRAAGVNRLSLGVQSFCDRELRALGRIHTAREAEEAFFMAREAGFTNISLDVMLATPHQTMDSVQTTLDAIARLAPEHVSAYSLIVEEGTPFAQMDLPLCDEDEERRIYETVRAALTDLGMMQYEISNFARTRRESRHNLKYWTMEPYLGFGAAASSFDGRARWQNEADLAHYLRGEGRRVERETLSDEELLRQRFWLGLRQTRGIAYHGEFPREVEKLKKNGLLEESAGLLRLTRRALDVANLVFEEFVE